MSELMQLCNVLSKTLQREDINISAASTQVHSLVSEIRMQRSENAFDMMWTKAEQIAAEIDVYFEEPRQRKVSRRLDPNWTTQVWYRNVELNSYFIPYLTKHLFCVLIVFHCLNLPTGAIDRSREVQV
jgi:hypothetical protein